MGSEGPTPLNEAETSGFQPRADRRAAGRRWGHRGIWFRSKKPRTPWGPQPGNVGLLSGISHPDQPLSPRLWRAAWGLEFSCSVTDSPWTPQEARDSTPCCPMAAVTQGLCLVPQRRTTRHPQYNPWAGLQRGETALWEESWDPSSGGGGDLQSAHHPLPSH